MYDFRANLILGFHGCDEETRDKLVNQPQEIHGSDKSHEWLGHGMYFWENNVERAWLWAHEKKARGELRTPSVVGAVLQLGHCCDLLDSKFIKVLKNHYQGMEKAFRDARIDLPKNIDIKTDPNKDKLLRILDCITIEFMHSEINIEIEKDRKAKGYSEIPKFDSTRGMFQEGAPVFEGSGIFEKSHIQICIRNPDCIKGFFIPRKSKQ